MIQPLPVPVDFDAHWEAVRREADGLPLDPRVQPWDAGGEARIAGVRLFRVTFAGAGGATLGGILHTPELPAAVGGGRRPALLHLAGYGGELLLHQDMVTAGFIVLDFSHRGMKWGSDGFDRDRPRPLLSRELT